MNKFLKEDPVTYKQNVLQLAQDAVNLVSKDRTVTDKNLTVYADYIGPGYEIPYSEANDDIRYLACSEGILTTTYTPEKLSMAC